MMLDLGSDESQSGAARTDSAVRWLLASVPLWALAGFFYPLMPALARSPAFQLQQFLTRDAGMTGAVAFRFALAAVSLPLTVLLGACVSAAQCIFLRAVRPWVGRWILAGAGGVIGAAGVAALASLALPAAQPGQNPIGRIIFQVLLRGALLGALASLVQRWSMRGRVRVPVYFVVASLVAGGAAGFGGLALALNALKALR